jgi:hypothetical protein
MTFHPHPGVMLPFSVSSDTNFFCNPFIYSNSLEASCFPAKWLPVHEQQQFADLSGPLGSNLPPLLAFAGNVLYPMQLKLASSSLRCLIFCFCSSITPIYCVSTLTFCKRGIQSQSADTLMPVLMTMWLLCCYRFIFHVLPPFLMNNARSR